MKFLRILFVAMAGFFAVQANAQCIGEEDAKKIEFAVEQISRICPTSVWDGWTFQQIVYDRDMNALCMVTGSNATRASGRCMSAARPWLATATSCWAGIGKGICWERACFRAS